MSSNLNDSNLDSSEISSSMGAALPTASTTKYQEEEDDRKDLKTELKQDTGKVNDTSTNKASSSKAVSPPTTTNRDTIRSILKQEQDVNKLRVKFLSMDLGSKRSLYKNGQTTLEEVKTWPEYYKEIQKGSQSAGKQKAEKQKAGKQKAGKQEAGKQETISDASDHFEVREDLNQKLSIFQGDITTLEIDAIANAANESLRGGGGVDGAIHSAAGSNLLAECETLGRCVAGDAKITCGYKLPAKYVIHTVGPRGENPKVLRSCYISCLELLKKHNLKTIAFPCISTGIFGYPNASAARVVLKTLREWLETDEYAVNVERIILCLFMKVDVDIYKKLMQVYFPVENQTVTDVNKNSSAGITVEEKSHSLPKKTSDTEEKTESLKDEF